MTECTSMQNWYCKSKWTINIRQVIQINKMFMIRSLLFTINHCQILHEDEGPSFNCRCVYKWHSNLVPHLLLHCLLAWKLWASIFPWFGVEWDVSDEVLELLHWWRGTKVRNRRKLRKRIVCYPMRPSWQEGNFVQNPDVSSVFQCVRLLPVRFSTYQCISWDLSLI